MPDGSGLTDAEYLALIEQHGGIINGVPLDPTIKDPFTKETVPNPQPKYKIFFQDGTEFTVRPRGSFAPDTGEWVSEGWTLIDPGTAYKPKQTPISGFEQVTDPRTGEVIGLRDPATRQVISLPKLPQQGPEAPKHASTANLEPVIDPNTGQKIGLRDPISGSVVSLPRPSATSNKPTALSTNTSAPYITIMQPDGTIKTVPNPNYQPGAQKSTFLTPNTQAPYLLQAGADGLQQIDNPNYVDPMEQFRQQQQVQAYWQGAQSAIQNQGNMYGNIASTIPTMYKYALSPGQEYATGFEPGGPWQKVMQRGGLNYNPDSYRVTPIQWDPAQMWQNYQSAMAAAWDRAMAAANAGAQQ